MTRQALWPRLKRALTSPWLADLVVIALLTWWGIHFFHPLEQVVNVELFDESGDIWAALRLPLSAYPPEYGPLYRLWYRLLALAQPDPIRLYYLSYRWVAILLPVALYVALRQAQITPALAFWSAALLLVSRGLSVVWPRVTIFWALTLVIALGIVWRLRFTHFWSRSAGYAWAFWWTAYVRPSMFLPAVALAGLALLAGLVTRFPGRRRPVLILSLTALLPLALWGNPYQSERLLVAFHQHFIVVRAALGDPLDNPWFQADRIGDYFPRPDSLVHMIQDRPDLIRAHLAYNLHQLPNSLAKTVLSPPGRLSLRWLRTKAGWLIFLWILPGLLTLGIPRRPTARRAHLLPALQEIAFLALPLILPLAVAVLIYPHPHYLFMSWISALLVYAYGLGVLIPQIWATSPAEATATPQPLPPGSLGWTPRSWGWLTLLVVFALGVWGTTDIQTWIPKPKDPTRRVVRVAEFVRTLQLPADRPIYTVGTEGQWEIYFGPQYRSLDKTLRTDPAPLADFLAAHQVGLILMGPGPTAYYCTATPARQDECQDLIAHPQAWGYRPFVLVLGHDWRRQIYYLFVRQDLLAASTPTQGGTSP